MISRRLFLKIISLSGIASLITLLGVPLSYYRSRWGPIEISEKPAERIIDGDTIYLPKPRFRGPISLEEALSTRRSIRDYRQEPLSIEELSQILWAAYGVTYPRYEFKTTPSAGATYPLEIYAVVSRNGVMLDPGTYLEPGSYKYLYRQHALKTVRRGHDLIDRLYRASLNQDWVREAPVNIVIAAVYERTTIRYGERGIRYVWIEVGHAGQNIYLQAAALGLATVAIGAFYDDDVKEIIGAEHREYPLYIMPVARPIKLFRFSEEEFERYIELNRYT